MERPPVNFDLRTITHIFYASASMDYEGRALIGDAARDEELLLAAANVGRSTSLDSHEDNSMEI